MEFWQPLWAAATMPLWELIAVFLSITYLLLAVKENNLCWYAAFFSTLIFTVLFWDASLLMDSALQVYYLGMAVYGWYQWRRVEDRRVTNKDFEHKRGDAFQSGEQNTDTTRPIVIWGLFRHGVVIAAVVVISLVSGFLLAENTRAAMPYLDSFTTWGSVVTTYMVAKKVLENWIYWVVIDAVSVYLYLDRGLYVTALLFCAYVLIALVGFRQWLQHYRQDQAVCPV